MVYCFSHSHLPDKAFLSRYESYDKFLHDRSWISPWVKSIFSESDITFHPLASQPSDYCDVISNRLWHHQQNWASETRGLCMKIVVFTSFMDSLCRERNSIMHVVSLRTVYVLTWVIFLCLFPHCCASRRINTKIIPSWAYKQFATRNHTLFYKYMQIYQSVCRIYNGPKRNGPWHGLHVNSAIVYITSLKLSHFTN